MKKASQTRPPHPKPPREKGSATTTRDPLIIPGGGINPISALLRDRERMSRNAAVLLSKIIEGQNQGDAF